VSREAVDRDASPTGEQFDWKVNREVVLPHGAKVRVLRRNVLDASTLAVDVLPFRENRAIWEYRANRASGTVRQVKAALREYSSVEGCDSYVLRLVTAPRSCLTVTIEGVLYRELTIWRFDEQLDMLQLRVGGTSGDLYSQLGGDRTLPTLADLGKEQPGDASVRTALTLYREGGAG